MPYPLATVSADSIGRVRIIPPVGCPGGEEWVLAHEAARWLELSYRPGPVPALPLELFWMPVPSRWNDPLGAVPIELEINPLGLPAQDFEVNWGDGSSETIPWTPSRADVPKVRHLYSQRVDLTVTVTMGVNIATLAVALLGCPVPPSMLRQTSLNGSTGGLAGVEPLVPSDGIDGLAYNGSRSEVWRLRLHPQGGLALLPSPVDGKPSLVVMNGSGAASRGSRWYAGDGPPPSTGLNPTPAAGDFYLNRANGQVYELIA